MAKYFKENNQASSHRVVFSDTAAKEVKNKVTIPMYFYNIIIPQLGDYYSNYEVDFDNKPVVCCPLHDEDTPSCRYYEHTNSFYCFGCRKGGNIINLHMYFAEKMNGERPEYEDAVMFLYNYFIKGKETEEFIDLSAQTLQQTKLNSDADLVKYNIYRVNLENSVTYDNSLKLSTKKVIWEALDTMDVLLSLNKIKANEAIAYLKNTVKNAVTPNSSIKQIDIREMKRNVSNTM